VDYGYFGDVAELALAVVARYAGYRGELPEGVLLRGNFPNPFSRITAVRFELPEKMDVKLSVFDVTGRKVAGLIDGPAGPGKIQYSWDGRNRFGHKVQSGVYFLLLEAGGYLESAKMVIVR
jgi:hypothetical protein